MGTLRLGRTILFAGIGILLMCGCSSGKAPVSPSIEPDSLRMPTQDPFDPGGKANPALPNLAWTFTEPSDLLDPDWGRLPATTLTDLTISATLYGKLAGQFEGDVYFSVDGKPYPFNFTNNILTGDIAGLIPGTHTVFVNAGSKMGCTNRVFRFEVVERPPAIQIGIGEDDGKLYLTIDRPMPASQLGDLSLWIPEDFDSDKLDVDVLPGNRIVSITMSKKFHLDDPGWFDQKGLIPRATFNSSLGESKAWLLGNIDDIERSAERHAQSVHCDQGETTSADCAAALGWTIDRSHLQPVDGEDRKIINIEYWDPYVIEPWSSCIDYTVVRHNYIGEGHLDYTLPVNWDAEFDNVMHSGVPYYVGDGHYGNFWQVFPRDYSYYPPSWCDWRWELILECNNCGGDPPGFESKGWHIDETLLVDHTPPDLDVEIVPGTEIHDYVSDLIGTLSGMGTVYTAGDQTGSNYLLFNHYMTMLGQYIDAWLETNPDGLCLVVEVEDPVSNEGNFLDSMISVDYEDQSEDRYFIDEFAEHFFYVDKTPLAFEEKTTLIWPKTEPGGLHWDYDDLYLHTDGNQRGEHSVWITVLECEFLEYNSLKLRATDEINNWARSEQLSIGDFNLKIGGCPESVEYDAPVNLTASLENLNDIYMDLEDNIKWSVQVEGGGQWVDYGPHEDLSHQYENSGYNSVISPTEDWTGPAFSIEHFRDCDMRVRARFEFCGDVYDDVCDIEDDPEYEITDLGYVVSARDLNHAWQGDDYDVLVSDLCEDNSENSVVLSRTETSTRELDVVVQVISDYEYLGGGCPSFLDNEITVVVTSPLDELSDEIDLVLYLVSPESTRHETLNAIFENAPQGSYAYYYARGGDLLVPYKPKLLICDPDALPPGNTPVLHISNNEGVDDFYDADNRDFSIAISHEYEDLYQKYSGALGSMLFGHSRGRFDFCNSGDELVEDFVGDVLDCGFELVSATVEEFTAEIGIRSESDVYFVIGHSGPGMEPCPGGSESPETMWDCEQSYDQNSIGGFGPIEYYITINEWSDYAALGDAEWLVTNACAILNDTSFINWKTELIDTGKLNSICGFRTRTRRSDLPVSGLFSGFSSRLVDMANQDLPNNNLWWDGNETLLGGDYLENMDPSVVAWMETACVLAREQEVDPALEDWKWLVYSIFYAAAIDSTHRWYIREVPVPGFLITTYEYYICVD